MAKSSTQSCNPQCTYDRFGIWKPLLVLDKAPGQIFEIKGLLIDLRERFGSRNALVIRHVIKDQAVVDRHHVAMTGEVDEEKLVDPHLIDL